MRSRTKPRSRIEPGDFRPAKDVLERWMIRKISLSPFGPGWWSFNPSIHYDRTDGTWRCSFRLANYSLPGGVVQLSPDARRGRSESRCAIAVLDPEKLEIGELSEMRELDRRVRSSQCASTGYEDMRLFRTARDGLCGVATALQLNLE